MDSTYSVRKDCRVVCVYSLHRLATLYDCFQDYYPYAMCVECRSLGSVATIRVRVMVYLQRGFYRGDVDSPIAGYAVQVSERGSIRIFSVLVDGARNAIFRSDSIRRASRCSVSYSLLQVRLVYGLRDYLGSCVFYVVCPAKSRGDLPLFFSASRYCQGSRFYPGSIRGS